MLQPKKTKFRRQQKGRMKGVAQRGNQVLPVLEKLEVFNEETVHAALFELIGQMGVKNGYLLWPVRVAVSGKALTPGGGIEICVMLGKEESLRRIRKGIEQLKAAL